MKHMRRSKTRVRLSFLALIAGISFAGDSAMDRATLRGLKAVKVVVDTLSPEIEHAGLDANQLRTEIEQKLLASGIKVDNTVNEFVGLTVSAAQPGKRGPLSIKKGPFSLAIGLGVYQVAILTRDQQTKTVVETWDVQKTISAPSKGLEHDVTSAVDELLDQFVKAYRSVNP
jgi:hypothetical protein